LAAVAVMLKVGGVGFVCKLSYARVCTII